MKQFRFSELYNVSRRRVLNFLKMDEDGGTTTIEFVLWLPIFILILGIIVDVCLLFLAQAIMYDVASDVARRASLSLYPDEATAEAEAAVAAKFRGTNATVNVTIGTTIIVEIKHNARNIDLTGVLSLLATDEIVATVTQLQEVS